MQRVTERCLRPFSASTGPSREARRSLLHEDDHRPPRVAAPRRPEPRHVGNSRREELHAAGLEFRPRARDVVAQHADVGDPALVTAGRPGSGGATSAAGYSISSMTRSSFPKPTMAAWTTTGDGTSSAISCSICAPSMRYGGDSTSRPRTSEYQRVAASTSGTQTAEWANPVSTASAWGTLSSSARSRAGGACSTGGSGRGCGG